MSDTNYILKFPRQYRSWDAVVLLHGLFADPSKMKPAADRLADNGYMAINFGYSTYFRTIDQHVQDLLPLLRKLGSDKSVRSINFLTHSFGGIVVRCALETEKIMKTSRAVMMAPPNSGTHLAKYSLGAFDRLIPVIRQISESPTSLPNRLSQPEGIEVGVIAAASDLVVRPKNTILKSQREHCIVPSTHFKLPFCDVALDKAVNFLKTGNFSGTIEESVTAEAGSAKAPQLKVA